MLVPVNHPLLECKVVQVKTPGLIKGPLLMVDSKIAEKEAKNTYQVRALTGEPVTIKIKPSFFDPIPKIEINGEAVELARSLTWYEMVWLCVPVMMIFTGGAIGGGLGAGAAYLNAHLFRSELSTPLKYAATFGVSTLSFIIYIAAATAIVVMLGK